MTNNLTTDSQKELLTQVDEKNRVLGGISRGVAHNTPGIFYRTIYVLVKNDKDEILLQKRSATKDLYPNCWDLSVGGHVDFGKSYIETAVREMKEELGLSVNEKDLVSKGEVLVRLPKNGEFFNVFEYKLKPTDIINTSKEEVSSIRWVSMEDIKKSIKDYSLVWYTRPEQIINNLY